MTALNVASAVVGHFCPSQTIPTVPSGSASTCWVLLPTSITL